MDFKLNTNAQNLVLQLARGRLQNACGGLVDYIKTTKLSKGRRGIGDFLGPGEAPYSWSGRMRQSVGHRWKDGDPNTQQVGIFAGGPGANPIVHMYAAVQEHGANIHGKKGLLTIPRTAEAIAHLKGGGTARSFPRPLTLIPSHGRKGIFFLVEQRRGGRTNPRRTEIHFVLARNVTIPPHPWLRPSLVEYGPQLMKDMAG